MRYWYDTEFLEDGRTIGLISIGIVAEDGREYYAVAKDADWPRINEDGWLRRNVLASLSPDPNAHEYKSRATIADEVRGFLLAEGPPELWADYGAYDHVVLCQLWGRMIDLPVGMPMYTNDIQHEAHRWNVVGLPRQVSGDHNALADARHCKVRWEYLDSLSNGRVGYRPAAAGPTGAHPAAAPNRGDRSG